VAEFDDPASVAAAFTTASPARSTARTLLLSGPIVGGAWASVLIARQAWNWPVPVEARIGFRAAVLTAVALLAVAAVGPAS
jgi:hypothetical protein